MSQGPNKPASLINTASLPPPRHNQVTLSIYKPAHITSSSLLPFSSFLPLPLSSNKSLAHPLHIPSVSPSI
ncbi:hypothetical protein E2C01_076579 [Portunus trituberculatus]|uniref:Uncharacterized protein n=1 Tax=Portunus trituberculatus TaxID=210409 RepID=A0A5B7IME9_PORTR|nr:hypothetical protein [Portunus trituberculatus]